ncbi:universal stress protein [Mycolicibacterium thermoresistibile]
MAEPTGAIVVGVDGSDLAVGAARWAGAVAAESGVGLHIVHAMPSLGRNLTETATAIRAAITSYQADSSQIFLADAADAVRAERPDLAITTESHPKPANEALIEASRTARLIVMGGNEVTVTSALLIGSTTLSVITHAHCPVVAWRGDRTAPTDAPVVVGVDGSAPAAAALRAGFEFAQRFGATLKAIRSWSTRLPPGAPSMPFLVDWAALEAAQLTELADEVDKHNQRHPEVAAECHVEPDGPAQAILNHAADAQLVVVGTRGRNALASTILGSTSLNLLNHAKVPVMVCRAVDDDES